jgi:excisionase family DNA binding protein
MRNKLPLQAPTEAPAPPEPIAVRIPEAMRLTGIGRSKLYELIASGDVETAKIGTCTLITFASLRQLIEKARR